MNQAYWARNPQAPFATLIAVAATYCHPEAYDDAYHDLSNGPGQRRRTTSRSACFEKNCAKRWPTRVGCPMTSYSRPSNTATGATRHFSAVCGATCTATSLPRARRLSGVSPARSPAEQYAGELVAVVQELVERG